MGCCNSCHGNEKDIGLKPQELFDLGQDREFVENVTKIQAHIRGHQIRKNLKPSNEEEEIHKPGEDVAKPCEFSSIPQNPIVQKIYKKLGPFKVEKNKEFQNLPKLGKFILIYI